MLSVFTSPITQQMIGFDSRMAPVPGDARIRYTQNMSTYLQNQDIIIQAFQRASLPSNEENDHGVQHLTPTCTKPRCTFPAYSSLAVCVKLKDISASLTVTKVPNVKRADGWKAAEV